ncbi:hypothetical protein AAOGI_06690 [Agarivorans albus]
MKDLFPGHFKDDQQNLKKAWDVSLFVFDANILLNLYRYSDTSRKEFIVLLDKMKERIWLPHRAAEEYLNNRLTVISQQEKSYDETKKSIESLKDILKNARQHPFVSKKVMENANKLFDQLCKELDENKSSHSARIVNDEIKDSIANIFENRVGQPFDDDKLNELISEGENRYKEKIPPGYKDGSKGGDGSIFLEKCRKFGDLIVWKQIIDKAIKEEKSIVLVTDDKKEDWWQKINGKTIGPRPELVKEFQDTTNQSFHMYKADSFLELARENLGQKVSKEIVEEIREVRKHIDSVSASLDNELHLKHLSMLSSEYAAEGKEIKMKLADLLTKERDLLEAEKMHHRKTAKLQAALKEAIEQNEDVEISIIKERINSLSILHARCQEELSQTEKEIEVWRSKLDFSRHRYMVTRSKMSSL